MNLDPLLKGEQEVSQARGVAATMRWTIKHDDILADRPRDAQDAEELSVALPP
jgi:hypothetical protein